MASQKRVLLQFGNHSRYIDIPSTSRSSKSERELLIERMKNGEELLWTTLKALSLTRAFSG